MPVNVKQTNKQKKIMNTNNAHYNYNYCVCVDRAQRLKDARQEALEEIEELKKKKNEELIENEKKVRNSRK